MKPFLCFAGGCEFEYIILELKSHPEKYFDFDYFYTFLADHALDVLATKPDAVLVSQHDYMMGPVADIQLNHAVSRQQQNGRLKELTDQCELMILTLLPLNIHLTARS